MVEHGLVYIGLVFKSPILHLKGGERSQGLMLTPHLPRAVLVSSSQPLRIYWSPTNFITHISRV